MEVTSDSIVYMLMIYGHNVARLFDLYVGWTLVRFWTLLWCTIFQSRATAPTDVISNNCEVDFHRKRRNIAILCQPLLISVKWEQCCGLLGLIVEQKVLVTSYPSCFEGSLSICPWEILWQKAKPFARYSTHFLFYWRHSVQTWLAALYLSIINRTS